VVPFVPGMNFVQKGYVAGAKCSVCGGFPEYRETNEHIRIRQKKEGPDRAVWLCSDCHRKYKLGEPDPDPEHPQEVTPDLGNEPAGSIPERSRSEIKRDRKLEGRDQKRPEVIPESPVSENNGPEPAVNGPEPENNGTETGPTPPRPTPQEYRPRGEYTIPDVLGDVSLGIERDAVGFVLTFYRNGGKVGSHNTKTPPWLSPKVVTDTGAALLKVCPDLGKVYAKEHVRDVLTEVFKEVERAITDNPHAAALLLPPVVSHVLGRIERVVITKFKDGFGGAETLYELFTGQDEENDPRIITLNLTDVTADSPSLFKKKWTGAFVTDRLVITRQDWETLISAIFDRAEIRESEHTGEADTLISDLLTELNFLTFTARRETWKDDLNRYLLCEHTPDGWIIHVSILIIHSFLTGKDLEPNKYTPKLSKTLKQRGLVVSNSRTIRVGPGSGGTKRVWTFSGDGLGFTENRLVDQTRTDPLVTGENFVTGKNDSHLTQEQNAPSKEHQMGGA